MSARALPRVRDKLDQEDRDPTSRNGRILVCLTWAPDLAAIARRLLSVQAADLVHRPGQGQGPGQIDPTSVVVPVAIVRASPTVPAVNRPQGGLVIFWASIARFGQVEELQHDPHALATAAVLALATDQGVVTDPALVIDQSDQAVVTVQASAIGRDALVVVTDPVLEIAQIDRVGEIVLALVIDQVVVTGPVMVIDQDDLAEAIDRIDPTGLVTFQIGLIDLTGLIAQAVRVGPTVPGGATAVSTIDLVGPTVPEAATSTTAGRVQDVQVTAWAIGWTATPIATVAGTIGATTFV